MMLSLPSKVRGRYFGISLVLFILVMLCMARLGPIGKSVVPFAFLYAVSFVLLVVIFKVFPDEWPSKKQVILIFGTAILLRIFFLTFPASFDVNRYIWEGYIYNHGFNPYLHAPDDPVLIPLVNDVWHDINHKDASAAYPPMIILFFGLLAYISHSPMIFKSIIILFDVGVVWLLMLMAESRQIKMSRLLIYAFNPLVLVFIAGEGHLDAIQIFFICLSLYCFMKKKDGWGFLTLGCAVMSKYHAIILLPFMLNGRNWKKCPVLLIPFLSYLPFIASGEDLFSSLMTFGTVMHYNDSLAVILRWIFGSQAALASICLLFLALAVIFFLVHDLMKSSYLAVASLLLLIPTLHPWYLILITPFLVFFPSRAWFYLHFAVIFTFPVLQLEFHTGVFQEIYGLKIFEYLPFFLLLMNDFIKQRSASPTIPFRHAKDFSVVIPTLNESRNIPAVLESLRREKGVLEIIVVDGGSSDETLRVAKELGAKVMVSEPGRGFQIAAGVNRCKGDIIIIHHADCRVFSGTLERVRNELERNPQYIGGSLGMCYRSKSLKTRILSYLNNLRAKWAGISFGDQGQFFRKEALDTIGGFPRQMLMEDVELSLRLKENGAVCSITKGIEVSHRRWAGTGFLANLIKVVTLCIVYLFKRRFGIGDAERREFYKHYYAVGNALNMKS